LRTIRLRASSRPGLPRTDCEAPLLPPRGGTRDGFVPRFGAGKGKLEGTRIRVLLTDDHAMFRQGVREMLSTDEGDRGRQ
jgi:hypothetical protein